MAAVGQSLSDGDLEFPAKGTLPVDAATMLHAERRW